jgi:hypothetical protein
MRTRLSISLPSPTSIEALRRPTSSLIPTFWTQVLLDVARERGCGASCTSQLMR